MSRSCLCQRLLLRAASDAAFRLLPDPVRLLWFDLVALASAAPVRGRLRFLGSVSLSVSRLVSRPETEIATELADLAHLGLIELDEDGASLWLPGAREGAARAEAARRNGSRGGRPRKGETPEQALRRRQQEMMLPIAGGAAAAAEPGETEPAKPIVVPATTTTHSSLSSSEGEGSAREAPDWVRLGMELAELAGMDAAKGGHDCRPVQGWLTAGIAPETIREAVREAVGRPSYRAGKVFTLGYFGGAVQRLHERGGAAIAPRWQDTAEELERIAAVEARIAAVRAGRSVAA
jgi:hypothetical protein